MQRSYLFFFSLCFAASLCLLAPNGTDAFADERDRIRDEMEHLEQKLNVVEEILERADDKDLPEREVDELVRMRERLSDHLEELERRANRSRDAHDRRFDEHESDSEEEHENEHDRGDHRHHAELERHMMSLEVHARELEIQKHGLQLEGNRHEVANRLAQLATDKHAFFAYSLGKVVESSHDPDHAIEVVRGLLGNTDDPVIRRILHSQMAQLQQSVGNPDQARDALMSILRSDNRKDRNVKRVRSERKVDDDTRR